MKENDTAYRPRHAVRCEEHGIFYNPATDMGCVICRREAGEETAPRSRWPIWAGVVLVLSIAGVVVSGEFASRSGSTPDAAEPAAAADHRMDAEPLRVEIENLESILYNPSPSDFSTAPRAAKAAFKLSARIQEFEKGLSGMFHNSSMKIFAFAGSVGLEEDAGYTLMSLEATRHRWEKVRGEVFQTAPWFRSSAASLDQEQKPKPPEIDPEMVATLRSFASDLQLLIVKGRPEAEAIGEPYVDAAERSVEMRRLGQQWNRWARAWMDDLDRLGSRMPPVPLDADERVLQAYNDLTQAMNALHAAAHSANDSGIPFRNRRTSNFDLANTLAQQAAAVLDDLS